MRPTVLAVFLFLAACSSAAGEEVPLDAASADGPADARLAPRDAGFPSDSGREAEVSDVVEAPVRFQIHVDYRFDTDGFFLDETRKKSLEAACRIWGQWLSSSFAKVPRGTSIRVRDPQKPTLPAQEYTLDYDIDDLAVFVGSSELSGATTGSASPTAGLSGVTDTTLRATLSQRYNGSVFQPWTAWISFDKSTNFYFDPDPKRNGSVPAGQIDFVSVALHELGHTLGFGSAPVFESKVSGQTFVGAKAVALFGGPVLLTSDLGHVPITTLSDGQRLLMDQSDALGTRYWLTPLDRAIFEDLGYTF